jgi:hypothetical protein
MKIQLCFSAKTKGQSEVILEKLKKLKQQLDKEYSGTYTVHSCHLTKKIVADKGFDPTIVNGFTDIFGDKYICEVTADTFDEAMKEMNNYRRKTALKVDRLIILSDEAVSNIALELELFTNKTVMYI